ncbi:ABC transporter ATP-binding protein [Saccharopolyspora cebuensis]|uniref:ABC transporter ATP-binding protein n=1 Tax=Saccharopolyspora cebuensis TaxID=418759 RepID=A0ABV4CFB2_9PSEU
MQQERASDDKSVLRTALRWGRGTALLLVLTALLATAAGLLLPAALADALDAVVSGAATGPALPLLAAVLGTGVLAEVVAVVLTARLTAGTTARLRADLAAHLVRLRTAREFADGDAVSRLTGDCTGAGQITALAVELGTAAILGAGSVIALALLDWRIAAVFLCSVPLALLLVRSHLRRTGSDVLGYQEAAGDLGARLLDAAAGLRTIAAAGVIEQETARVLRPLPRLAATGAGMWRTQARMTWRSGLLLPLVQIAVLATAGIAVLEGSLRVGDVLAASGYAALGLGLVRQAPLFTALARARSCAERIAAVLAAEPEPDGARPLPPGPGTVELRGAGSGDRLSDVDLVVPGGTAVAVVGSSGAGKSALAEVLGGLRRPDTGSVRLDGVELSELDPGALRAAVGHAFERPALLGPTIGAAVGRGTTASAERIEDACRAARIHDLIARLPLGYDTPLERTPLSGGEAQRVGLARALVRAPRLLVLDDATAGLDAVTERQVEAALDAAGCTRVVVTHRVGTARRADAVVWLAAGRVRGTAPHEVLWADPDYRAVFA